jgi:hypothetical protein
MKKGLLSRIGDNIRQGIAGALSQTPYRQAAGLISDFLADAHLEAPEDLERAIDAGALHLEAIISRIPPEGLFAAREMAGERLRHATREDYLAVLQWLHETKPEAANVLVRRFSWFCRQMDGLIARILS